MTATEPNKQDKSAHVSWALAYPFDVPDRSFVYLDGAIFDFDHDSLETWSDAHVIAEDRAIHIREIVDRANIGQDQVHTDRIPVIACGSNASPQRLKQKFDQDLPGSLVPTVKATLTHYSVVFAAKFTEYGSMPATLAYTPGAQSEVYVNFLTPEQMAVMDGTETLGCSYDRPVLENAEVQLENGTWVENVHAYISRHGCFAPYGEAISLTSVVSLSNPFAQMEQPAVQRVAKRIFDSPLALDDFVFENISDEDLRRSRSQYLAAHYSIPAGRGDLKE